MGTKQYTITDLTGEGSAFKISWIGLGSSDDGAPIDYCRFGDRSVQFVGTFGSGGTIVWEGSNDGGTTYNTLSDPGGTAISRTTAGLKAVLEMTAKQRPRATAGDGTTAIDCHLFVRLGQPLRV